MVRTLYRFHVYYHVRRVMKRLQVSLLHETSFNAADNPYTSEEFFKICEDYKVPNDSMKYRDEKFYLTYQHGVIMEKSQGFTNVGFYRVSESVRAYAYLILNSQASVRSGIIGNTVSALTTQKAFLNNFENVINRRVDVREDIKRYQDTLSYALNKVDYSVRENIYILPSDMNLLIRSGTIGYNNKILISDGKFSLGKNDKVNVTPKISHQPTITHVQKQTITHVQKQTITHAQKQSLTKMKKLPWYFS